MLAALTFGAALGLAAADAPSRPVLITTFTATQSGFSYETGSVNNTISGVATVSAAVPGQIQHQALPDGRSVAVVFNYDTDDDTKAGAYSLQPFFDSHVCYIYPLPMGRGYKPIVFPDALEEVWCQQAAPCTSAYEQSTYKGMSQGVDGTPCQQWEVAASDDDKTAFCVTEAGGLLDVEREYHSGSIDIVARTHFANYSTTVDPAGFDVPTAGCVDLRKATPAATDGPSSSVNHAGRLAKTNEEAAGVWLAEPSAVFEGYSLADASTRLGVLGGYSFELAPSSAAPVLAPRMAASPAATNADEPVPAAFDARDKWGSVCSSIVTVRNQGDCGGCWAFSAAETLADRFCVAGAQAASPNGDYANLSLSPQWILDCDTTDMGCGGGLLDDAWYAMEKIGVVSERCDPYMWCAHPASPSCETGQHPVRPTPTQLPCPTTCRNGALTRTYNAATAYAVAAPGDVEAMQRDLMAHGPFQVGFQVFSDFMTYKNGTYFRTPSAQGPNGGHAVKIVGWGVDAAGMDYWTVANSWSADWGMDGFFNIRRGTNECGIETTPAAGLPAM